MNSEDIFLERMAFLVYVEKRPFCFKDFLFFEHNGKEYEFKHGTIRNMFSIMTRKEKIERVYHSNLAFYTLKGVEMGKPITLNHGEDYLDQSQKSFFQWLKNLPTDKPAIHDIRLRFSFRDLWSILSISSSDIIRNKDKLNNKDITLHDVKYDDSLIKTTVHCSDTVSVIVACTNDPIPIDEYGRIRLTSGLAIIHNRLQTLLDESQIPKYPYNRSHLIFHPMTWFVDMWHFGLDSSYGYSGKRFELKWGDALGVFRVYSKKK